MSNLFDNLFSNIKDTKEDEKDRSKSSTHESKASKYDRQKTEIFASENAKATTHDDDDGTGDGGACLSSVTEGANPVVSGQAPAAILKGRSSSSSSHGSGRRESSSSQPRRRDVSSRDLFAQSLDVETVNKESEFGDPELDIDTLKKFTIPKRQKAKKGLYEDLTLNSREYKNEILPIIQQNFKDRGGSTQAFKFHSAQLVNNQSIWNEYQEKKREMRQNGYSEKETVDSYAFLLVFDQSELQQICKDGIRAGNMTSSCIGDATKGVTLCRYSDILRSSPLHSGQRGKLVIFQVMKGKVKPMVENRGEIPLDPTPNFDCHISKNSSVDPTQVGMKQAFESTQLYLYEYDEDFEPKAKPRQILPYAVLPFQYVSTGEPKPLKPVIKPSPISRPPSIPAPKPAAAPKEVQRTEWGNYVVWTGVLKNKNTLSCNVELVTYNTAVKPARIPNEILMNMIYPLSVLESRFLSNVNGLVKGNETKYNGKYYNCCDIRAQKGDESNLRRLIKFLEVKKKFLITKFEEDVTVLLVPDCEVTMKAGLPSSKSPVISLNCIFISPKSRMAAFKAPPVLTSPTQTYGGGFESLSSPQLISPSEFSPLTPQMPSMYHHPVTSQPIWNPQAYEGSPQILMASPDAFSYEGFQMYDSSLQQAPIEDVDYRVFSDVQYAGPPGMGYSPAVSFHPGVGHDGTLQAPASEDSSYSRQGQEKHYDHHGRATSSASTKVLRQNSRPPLLPTPVESSPLLPTPPVESKSTTDLIQSGATAGTANPKLLDLVYKLSSGKINNQEAISQITKLVASDSGSNSATAAPSSHDPAVANRLPAEPTVRQQDIDLREPPRPTRVTSITEEFPDDAFEFDRPRRFILRKYVISNAFKAEKRVQDKRNFELVRSGGNLSGGTRLSYQSYVPLFAHYLHGRDGPHPAMTKKEPWGVSVSGKQMARDPRFRPSLGSGSEVPTSALGLSAASPADVAEAATPPVSRQHSAGTTPPFGNFLSEEVLPTATLTSILQKFSPAQIRRETSTGLKLQSLKDNKSGGSSPAEDPALAEMDLYGVDNSGSSSPTEAPYLEEEKEETTEPVKPKTGYYSTYTPSDIEKQLSNLNSPKMQAMLKNLHPAQSPAASASHSQQQVGMASFPTSLGISASAASNSTKADASDSPGGRSASDLAKSLLQKLHIPVVPTPSDEAVKHIDIVTVKPTDIATVKPSDIATVKPSGIATVKPTASANILVKKSHDPHAPSHLLEAVQQIPAMSLSQSVVATSQLEDANNLDKLKEVKNLDKVKVREAPESAKTTVAASVVEEMDEDAPIKSIESMKSFLNEDVDTTEKLALPFKTGMRRSRSRSKSKWKSDVSKLFPLYTPSRKPKNKWGWKAPKTAIPVYIPTRIKRKAEDEPQEYVPSKLPKPVTENADQSSREEIAATENIPVCQPRRSAGGVHDEAIQRVSTITEQQNEPKCAHPEPTQASIASDAATLPGAAVPKLSTGTGTADLPKPAAGTTADSTTETDATKAAIQQQITPIPASAIKIEKDDSNLHLQTNSKYSSFLSQISRESGNFEGNYLLKSGLDLPVRKPSRGHGVMCGPDLVDVHVVFKWNPGTERLNNNGLTSQQLIEASLSSAVHRQHYRFKRQEVSEREKVNEEAVKKVLHRIKRRPERKVALARSPANKDSNKGQKSPSSAKTGQPSPSAQRSPIAADKPTGPKQALPKGGQKESRQNYVLGQEPSSPGTDFSESSGAIRQSYAESGVGHNFDASSFPPVSSMQGLTGPVPLPGFVSLSKYVPMKGITPLTSQAQGAYSQFTGAAMTKFSANSSSKPSQGSSQSGMSSQESREKIINQNSSISSGRATRKSELYSKKIKSGEAIAIGEKPEKFIKEPEDDVPELSALPPPTTDSFTSFRNSLQQKAGIKLVLRSSSLLTESPKSKLAQREDTTAASFVTNTASVTSDLAIATPVTATTPVRKIDYSNSGLTIPVLMNRAVQKITPASLSMTPPVVSATSAATYPISSLGSTTYPISSLGSTTYPISSLGSTPNRITPGTSAASPISVRTSTSAPTMMSSWSLNTNTIQTTEGNLRAVPMSLDVSKLTATVEDDDVKPPIMTRLPDDGKQFPVEDVKPPFMTRLPDDGKQFPVNVKAEPVSPAKAATVSTSEPATDVMPVAAGDVKKEPAALNKRSLTTVSCGFCWKSFKGKVELERHKVATGHGKPTKYICQACSIEYGCEQYLEFHLNSTGHFKKHELLSTEVPETSSAASATVKDEPKGKAADVKQTPKDETLAASKCGAKLQCGFCWNTFPNSDALFKHTQLTGHSTPDLSTVKKVENEAAKKLEEQNKAKQLQRLKSIADKVTAAESQKSDKKATSDSKASSSSSSSSKTTTSKSDTKKDYSCDVCEKAFESEKDFQYHVQCSGHEPSSDSHRSSSDRHSRRYHPYEKASVGSSKPVAKTSFVNYQNLRDLMGDMTTPQYKQKRERGECSTTVPVDDKGARFKGVKFIRSTDDPESSKKFDLKSLNEPDKDEALVDERPDDFEERRTQTRLLAEMFEDVEDRESVDSNQDRDSGRSSRDDSDGWSNDDPLDDSDMFKIIGMKPPGERILEPEDYSFEVERTTRSYAALLRGGILGRPPEPAEPEMDAPMTDDPMEPLPDTSMFDDAAFSDEMIVSPSEVIDRSADILSRSLSVPELSAVEMLDANERLGRSMSVAEGERRRGYRLHRIDVKLRVKVYVANPDVEGLLESEIHSDQDPRMKKKDYCKPKFNVEDCWKKVDLKSPLLSNLVITITRGDSSDDETDEEDIPVFATVIKTEPKEEEDFESRIGADEPSYPGYNEHKLDDEPLLGDLRFGDKPCVGTPQEYNIPQAEQSIHEGISHPPISSNNQAFAMNSSYWDSKQHLAVAGTAGDPYQVGAMSLMDPRMKQLPPVPFLVPPMLRPPGPPPQSMQSGPTQTGHPSHIQDTLNLLQQCGVNLPSNQVAMLWSKLNSQNQLNIAPDLYRNLDPQSLAPQSYSDAVYSTPERSASDSHDRSCQEHQESQKPIVFDYGHSSVKVYQGQGTAPRSRDDHISPRRDDREAHSPRDRHSPRSPRGDQFHNMPTFDSDEMSRQRQYDRSPSHSSHSPASSRKESSPRRSRRDSSPSHIGVKASSSPGRSDRPESSPSSSGRNQSPRTPRRESSPSQAGRNLSPRQSRKKEGTPGSRDDSPRQSEGKELIPGLSDSDDRKRAPVRKDLGPSHSGRNPSPDKSSRNEENVDRYRKTSPSFLKHIDSIPHSSSMKGHESSQSRTPLADEKDSDDDVLVIEGTDESKSPLERRKSERVQKSETFASEQVCCEGADKVKKDPSQLAGEHETAIVHDEDVVVLQHKMSGLQQESSSTDDDINKTTANKSGEENKNRYDIIVVGDSAEKDPKLGGAEILGSPTKLAARKGTKFNPMKVFLTKTKKREDTKKVIETKKEPVKLDKTHATVKSEIDRFRQMERAVLSKTNCSFNTINVGDLGKALSDDNSNAHLPKLQTPLSLEATNVRNIKKIIRSAHEEFEETLKENRLDPFNFEIDAFKSQSIGIDTTFSDNPGEEFSFARKFEVSSTDSSPEKKPPHAKSQDNFSPTSHLRPLHSLFKKELSISKSEHVVDSVTNGVIQEIFEKLNRCGSLGGTIASVQDHTLKDWENDLGALAGDSDYWCPKAKNRQERVPHLKPLLLCPKRRLDEIDGISKTVQGEIFNTLLKLSDLAFEDVDHTEAILREQESLSPVRDHHIKSSNGSYWLNIGGKLFSPEELLIPGALPLGPTAESIKNAMLNLSQEAESLMQPSLMQPLKIDISQNYEAILDSLYSPSEPTQDSPTKRYSAHSSHHGDKVGKFRRFKESPKAHLHQRKVISQEIKPSSSARPNRDSSPQRKEPKPDRMVKRMLADIDGYSKWEGVEISTSSESEIPNPTARTDDDGDISATSLPSYDNSPERKPKKTSETSAVVLGKSHALYNIAMMKSEKQDESSDSDSDELRSQIEMAIAESLQPRQKQPRRRGKRKRSSQDTGNAVDDITDSDDDMVGSDTESDSDGDKFIKPATPKPSTAKENDPEAGSIVEGGQVGQFKPVTTAAKPISHDMFSEEEPELTMKANVSKPDDDMNLSETPGISKESPSKDSSFKEIDQVNESRRILPPRFKLDFKSNKDAAASVEAEHHVEEMTEVKTDPVQRKSPELSDMIRIRFPNIRGRGARGRGCFAKRGGRKAQDLDAEKRKRKQAIAEAKIELDDDYMKFDVAKHVDSPKERKAGGSIERSKVSPTKACSIEQPKLSPTKGLGGKNLLLKAFKQMVQTKKPTSHAEAHVQPVKDNTFDEPDGQVGGECISESNQECQQDKHEIMPELDQANPQVHDFNALTSSAQRSTGRPKSRDALESMITADIPLPGITGAGKLAEETSTDLAREELFETPIYRRSHSRSPTKQPKEGKMSFVKAGSFGISQKQKLLLGTSKSPVRRSEEKQVPISPPKSRARLEIELQRAEAEAASENISQSLPETTQEKEMPGKIVPPRTRARMLLELERAEAEEQGNVSKHRENSPVSATSKESERRSSKDLMMSPSYWTPADDGDEKRGHDAYNRCFRSRYSYEHGDKSDCPTGFVGDWDIIKKQTSNSPASHWSTRSPSREQDPKHYAKQDLTDREKLEEIRIFDETIDKLVGRSLSSSSSMISACAGGDVTPKSNHLHALSEIALSLYKEISALPFLDTTPCNSEVSDWASTPEHSAYSQGSDDDVGSSSSFESDTDIPPSDDDELKPATEVVDMPESPKKSPEKLNIPTKGNNEKENENEHMEILAHARKVLDQHIIPSPSKTASTSLEDVDPLQPVPPMKKKIKYMQKAENVVSALLDEVEDEGCERDTEKKQLKKKQQRVFLRRKGVSSGTDSEDNIDPDESALEVRSVERTSTTIRSPVAVTSSEKHSKEQTPTSLMQECSRSGSGSISPEKRLRSRSPKAYSSRRSRSRSPRHHSSQRSRSRSPRHHSSRRRRSRSPQYHSSRRSRSRSPRHCPSGRSRGSLYKSRSRSPSHHSAGRSVSSRSSSRRSRSGTPTQRSRSRTPQHQSQQHAASGENDSPRSRSSSKTPYDYHARPEGPYFQYLNRDTMATEQKSYSPEVPSTKVDVTKSIEMMLKAEKEKCAAKQALPSIYDQISTASSFSEELEDGEICEDTDDASVGEVKVKDTAKNTLSSSSKSHTHHDHHHRRSSRSGKRSEHSRHRSEKERHDSYGKKHHSHSLKKPESSRRPSTNAERSKKSPAFSRADAEKKSMSRSPRIQSGDRSKRLSREEPDLPKGRVSRQTSQADDEIEHIKITITNDVPQVRSPVKFSVKRKMPDTVKVELQKQTTGYWDAESSSQDEQEVIRPSTSKKTEGKDDQHSSKSSIGTSDVPVNYPEHPLKPGSPIPRVTNLKAEEMASKSIERRRSSDPATMRSSPTPSDTIHGPYTPPAKRQCIRDGALEPDEPRTYAYVCNTIDDTADLVKKHLTSQNIQLFDPRSIETLDLNKMFTRILVFIHEEDIPRANLIPNLLVLKKDPRVLFCPYGDVSEVIEGTYRRGALFSRGGMVVPDEDILLECLPDQLKTILEYMLEQQRCGNPWSMKVHSQVICKLAEQARDPDSSTTKRAHAILELLTTYRNESIVELLPKHKCDMQPKLAQEYLPCLLDLQRQHCSSSRFTLMLCDHNKMTSAGALKQFHRNAIGVVDLQEMLHGYFKQNLERKEQKLRAYRFNH